MIKTSIKHHALQPYQKHSIQATSIRIEDTSDYLNLSAVYCPPKHKIKEELFTDFFNSLGSRFIAGGDFNSKNTYWGSRTTTTRGRELKKCVDSNHLTPISTGEPTYWPTDPNKKPDLLDFFICRNICQLHTLVESCFDGSSDHTPAILTLSSTVINVGYNETLCNKDTDWDSFQDYINDNIDMHMPLKTSEDVETACSYITNLIQVAAWKSSPEEKPNIPKQNIPLHIKNKIQDKRRLRRVWHASRHPSDKAALNKASRELKKILQEAKNATVKHYVTCLSANGKGEHSLWKATKGLNQPQIAIPPIRSGTTSWARSDSEKAEVFAKHLASVFQPNEGEEDTLIDEVLNQDFQLDLPLKPTSPREIHRRIKELETHKAPGFDLITPRILKELPRRCVVFLACLFNAIFRTHHVPSIWKVSQIILVHKNGKPTDRVDSYRPISLTPILSKLWETILLHRLSSTLAKENIIPEHQFGFRKMHATIEQVHRVYNAVRQCFEKKEYCSAAFIDIQQAFDRVWHKGLLYKIKTLLPHSFYPILSSYLSNRLFQVKQKEARSSLYECKAGVPQGSVLGPVLYNIFTSDMPQTPRVTIATYADDAAFLSCDREPEIASLNLQLQLDQTNIWLKKWRIKASAQKSNHITFTLNRRDCPGVRLGDATLPHSNSVKYLGFHLDRRLTWSNHIKKRGMN